RFCKPEQLTIAQSLDIPEKAMTAVVTGAEIYLPLEGLIDFDKEIARLEKELEKWQKEVDFVQKKLANKNFVEKAPEKLVSEQREKEVEYLDKYNRVKARLEELNNNIGLNYEQGALEKIVERRLSQTNSRRVHSTVFYLLNFLANKVS